MRKVIVGWANTFHDPAIAVLEGDNVFAEAVERHVQCKRALDVYRFWYSRRPLQTGLQAAGIEPLENADVSVLTSWDPQTFRENKASHLQYAEQMAGHINEWGGDASTLAELESGHWDDKAILRGRYETLGGVIPVQLASMRSTSLTLTQLQWIFAQQGAQLSPVPDQMRRGVTLSHKTLAHHQAHAANAAYTSPFKDAAVLVIDGWGDATATTLFRFSEDKEEPFERVHSAHASLGFLYAGATALCGFDLWEGEEWKVMGLAAYGSRDDRIYDFFRSRVYVDGLDIHRKFSDQDQIELYHLAGGFRQYGDADPLRAANLAHTFQLFWEDLLIDLCKNIYELGISKNLCVVGGCALNSSANGKILSRTGFERLHVPSAPGDDGNALGVALFEKHGIRKEKRTPGPTSPYLGNAVDLPKLEKILSLGGIKYEKATDDADLCARVSDILSEGKIIGWMQGRAEFGPRALGNRSILADPRRADMQELVNARVKFREDYRPLAPSILHEYGPEYFEDYQESPYMERALRFREAAKSKVPAVVHKDGTGRLQTVKEELNPLFHALIKAFFDKTGIPLLVNTSLNVMGKPIVHSVDDAITVFYTSGLDHIVIGPYILSK